MKVIFKYPIQTYDTVISLPKGGTLRHVGFDLQGQLCLWIEQDRAASMVSTAIFVRGTGMDVPIINAVFLGTAAAPGQPFVWHVWGAPQS